MVAGVPSKALQLLNLPVKFNPREPPKPVWEPLTSHGMGMVKRETTPTLPVQRPVLWSDAVGSKSQSPTSHFGHSLAHVHCVKLSPEPATARIWQEVETSISPLSSQGKAERKSIKVFCCFKEDWCLWWWQSFEAYAQERSHQFNTLGYIQTASNFGKRYKEGNLSSAPRCWDMSKCFILWSKLNLNH